MTKLNLHVTFTKAYDGNAQIVREVVPHDNMNLEEYLRETLVASRPKDQSELDAMATLYGYMNMPVRIACNFYVQGECADGLKISELRSKGDSIDVVAEHSHTAGYVGTNDEREYLEFRCKAFSQNLNLYRKWQAGRMDSLQYPPRLSSY